MIELEALKQKAQAAKAGSAGQAGGQVARRLDGVMARLGPWSKA